MTAGFLHGRSFLTTIIVKFKVRFMFAYAKFSKYFFSQPKQSNSKAILQFFFGKYEPSNVYKLKKSCYCETNTNPKYWLTELIKIVLTIKTTLILSL